MLDKDFYPVKTVSIFYHDTEVTNNFTQHEQKVGELLDIKCATDSNPKASFKIHHFLATDRTPRTHKGRHLKKKITYAMTSTYYCYATNTVNKKSFIALSHFVILTFIIENNRKQQTYFVVIIVVVGVVIVGGLCVAIYIYKRKQDYDNDFDPFPVDVPPHRQMSGPRRYDQRRPGPLFSPHSFSQPRPPSRHCVEPVGSRQRVFSRSRQPSRHGIERSGSRHQSDSRHRQLSRPSIERSGSRQQPDSRHRQLSRHSIERIGSRQQSDSRHRQLSRHSIRRQSTIPRRSSSQRRHSVHSFIDDSSLSSLSSELPRRPSRRRRPSDVEQRHHGRGRSAQWRR